MYRVLVEPIDGRKQMELAAEHGGIQTELDSLHRGMVLDLDRRAPIRRDKPRQPTPAFSADIGRDISDAVGLIRVAAKEIGDLRSLIQKQDVAIEDLKVENGLFAKQEKIDAEEIVRLERELAAEKEKSMGLQTQLGTSETELRRLEDHCEGLQGNLTKVTGAIRESLATLSAPATRRLSGAAS